MADPKYARYREAHANDPEYRARRRGYDAAVLPRRAYHGRRVNLMTTITKRRPSRWQRIKAALATLLHWWLVADDDDIEDPNVWDGEPDPAYEVQCDERLHSLMADLDSHKGTGGWS